jgi:hypothetical protein
MFPQGKGCARGSWVIRDARQVRLTRKEVGPGAGLSTRLASHRFTIRLRSASANMSRAQPCRYASLFDSEAWKIRAGMTRRPTRATTITIRPSGTMTPSEAMIAAVRLMRFRHAWTNASRMG